MTFEELIGYPFKKTLNLAKILFCIGTAITLCSTGLAVWVVRGHELIEIFGHNGPPQR